MIDESSFVSSMCCIDDIHGIDSEHVTTETLR